MPKPRKSCENENAKAPQSIAARTRMEARILKSELPVQTFESEAVNDSVVNQNREPKSRGGVRMLLFAVVVVDVKERKNQKKEAGI